MCRAVDSQSHRYGMIAGMAKSKIIL